MRRLAGATAVLCLLLPPASASGFGEPETGGVAAFQLRGSHGYRIFVLAGSKPGYRNGEILVFIGKPGGGTVTYSAPAEVTDTTLRAELGSLGQIDVEFRGGGTTKVAHSRCSDDRLRYEPGTYEGSIVLQGEEGFTSVEATTVPLDVTPFLDLGCFVVGFGETWGSGIPGARLSVSSKTRFGRISLQANENRPGARLRLSASIDERRGQMEISRSVGGMYPSRGFEFDPSLRTATLRPGSPFSGSATFRRFAAEGNRWTGNLTVGFPGRSDVPLNGAGFKSTLVHATFHGSETRRRGERSQALAPLLRYAQQRRLTG